MTGNDSDEPTAVGSKPPTDETIHPDSSTLQGNTIGERSKPKPVVHYLLNNLESGGCGNSSLRTPKLFRQAVAMLELPNSKKALVELVLETVELVPVPVTVVPVRVMVPQHRKFADSALLKLVGLGYYLSCSQRRLLLARSSEST